MNAINPKMQTNISNDKKSNNLNEVDKHSIRGTLMKT